MKNFKIILCLILSAALFFGILPLNSFAATAISDAALVNFTKPTVGMTAAEATTATVPAGAHYRITESAWYCESDEDDMYGDDVFKYANLYSFGVTLVADSGYTFSNSTSVTINGGTALIDWDYTRFDSANNCFYVWTLPDYSVPNGPSTVINTVNVNIDELPRPDIEVCELSDPYVSGSAPYEIEDWYWYDEFSGKSIDEDDWFSQGRGYSLCATLKACDGYEFAEAITFLVNSGSELASTQYSMVYDLYTAILWTVPLIAEYPEEPGVKSVALNGYETPVIGQKASQMPISVPAGEGYRLVSSGWYKSNGTVMGASDAFAKSVEYYLYCVIELDEGLDFASSLSVQTAAPVDYGKSYIDGNRLYLYTAQTYAYAGLITRIDIIMAGNPDPGLAPEDLPDPTVPSGANYRVIDWMWYCDTDNDELYEDDPFEAGKEYSLEVVIEPLNNYGYSVNTAVYFNGRADAVDTDGSYINQRNLYCVWTLPVISGEVAELQPITQVNLKNFTLPKVGQTSGENLGPVTAGDGAHYTVSSIAWHLMADGDFTVKDSDVFEAGKTYYLSVTLEPEYGYYFDGENLPVTLLSGSAAYVDSPYSRVNHGLGEGTYSFFSVELEPVPATEITYGDCNGDGEVTGKDLIRLRKYLNGDNVEIFPGADVNGDSEITGKDLIRLRKYLSSGNTSLLGPEH